MLLADGKSSDGLQYLIMTKFGPTLRQMLLKSKFQRFTVKTSVQIGLQLIDNLEALHKCGFTHNDIKLQNILVKDPNRKTLSSSQISLIDFGLTERFLSQSLKHAKQGVMPKFKGNCLFASHNAFRKITLSRRDDLISTCYLLIYLFEGGNPWTDQLNADQPLLPQVGKIRLKQTPETLCTNQAKPLLPFVEEVWSYKFQDEPKYSKLKQLLRCVLLDKDIVPNLKFDWSEFTTKNLLTSK